MLDDLIDVCERAAWAGAGELLAKREQLEVREKGPADLVTNADLASEEAIRRLIKESYPDHVILGEERGLDDGVEDTDDGVEDTDDGVEDTDYGVEDTDYLWVIDPLDGTSNYVHDLPFYCVSVAVRQGGETVVGTVIDPLRQEVFRAAKGRGATRNGLPITVRPCHALDEAMLAVSLPPRRTGLSREIARLAELAPLCRAFRRLGAAALILSYMAAGRIDGYWASQINLWDRAAGELLVREAGGLLGDLEGNPLTSTSTTLLAAGTETLFGSLQKHLSEPSR